MRTLPAKGNVRAFAVTSAATPRRSLKGQLYLRSNTEKRNLKLRREEFYAKNQVHIHPADAVDAVGGIGFVDVPEKAG